MFVKAFIMESEVKDSLSVYKVCSVLFTHTHTPSVNKHTQTKYSQHFPSEQTFSGLSSRQAHSFTYTRVCVCVQLRQGTHTPGILESGRTLTSRSRMPSWWRIHFFFFFLNYTRRVLNSSCRLIRCPLLDAWITRQRQGKFCDWFSCTYWWYLL